MSLKKTFSSDGKKCTVVFNVNPNAAANADKVYLVGDFNSWDETSIPMKKGPDGSFSVKKQLDTNNEYQFRYCLEFAGSKVWINIPQMLKMVKIATYKWCYLPTIMLYSLFFNSNFAAKLILLIAKMAKSVNNDDF